MKKVSSCVAQITSWLKIKINVFCLFSDIAGVNKPLTASDKKTLIHIFRCSLMLFFLELKHMKINLRVIAGSSLV